MKIHLKSYKILAAKVIEYRANYYKLWKAGRQENQTNYEWRSICRQGRESEAWLRSDELDIWCEYLDDICADYIRRHLL